MGIVLGFSEFVGEAFTVVIVAAVVGEDVEAGIGEAVGGLVAVVETFWVAAGLDVPVSWAEVTIAWVEAADGRAEACGKSFATLVLTAVVTVGVTLSVFDIMLAVAVIVVAGTDVETALTPMGDEDAVAEVVAAGAATVEFLAELCPFVLTVAETEGSDSTGALESVEIISVGSTPKVDVSVLAGGCNVV